MPAISPPRTVRERDQFLGSEAKRNGKPEGKYLMNTDTAIVLGPQVIWFLIHEDKAS